MNLPPAAILELPSNISATYLSEGAANVVYTINVPPQDNIAEQGDAQEESKSITPNPWHGKLLRFRKDLPTTIPTETAHTAFLQSIAPLFPDEDLIDIRLVSLSSTHLIHALNAALRAAELPSSPSDTTPDRPQHRHGVYLAHDPHALLITDMSPPPSSTLIQFKPKWLAPSPSAPPSPKRCRTCALHARRGRSSRPFCPLDLMSSSPTDVRRAAASLLGLPFPPNSETTPAKLAQLNLVANWAQGSPLLRRLRDFQVSHDPEGVLEVVRSSGEERSKKEEGLQIAMTLRDVTVFLVVPGGGEDKEGEGEGGGGGGGGELRARLGDLDVKSLGKVGEWESVETGLGEGWYQGMAGEGEAVDCWLGREERGWGGDDI